MRRGTKRASRSRQAMIPSPRTRARGAKPGAKRKGSSSDAVKQADESDDRRLGPYELRYDVRRGYGVERTVIRP